MAAGRTYTPIATQTLGSAAASVTFSSIPGTYTDLVLRISARMSVSGPDNINVKINSFINSHSYTELYANSGTVASARSTGVGFFRLTNILPGTESTATSAPSEGGNATGRFFHGLSVLFSKNIVVRVDYYVFIMF